MLQAKNRASFWAVALGSVIISAYAFGCGGEACETSDCGAAGTGGAGTSSSSASGTGGGGIQETFACKGEMCLRGKEHCEVQQDNVIEDVGTCLPLPKECTDPGTINPDCTCFEDLTDNCQCSETPEGDFAVFCAPL